jgi:hypothetical protein
MWRQVVSYHLNGPAAREKARGYSAYIFSPGNLARFPVYFCSKRSAGQAGNRLGIHLFHRAYFGTLGAAVDFSNRRLSVRAE